MQLNPRRLPGNLRGEFLAITSMAFIAVPVVIVAASAPASAETKACSGAFDQFGSRCASLTFSIKVESGTTTKYITIAVTTAEKQTQGSHAGLSRYVYEKPAVPEQDFDTLSVNSQGVPDNNGTYSELRTMPYGSLKHTLCLEATSPSAGASFVLAKCSSSRLDLFNSLAESPQGLGFEWHLKGSGSPGLAITDRNNALTLETWSRARDQWMNRTD